MKEGMSKAGYVNGDMSPKVKDYQRPRSDFSQEGFSETLEYIERQDKHQKQAANDIRRQGYKGRYN